MLTNYTREWRQSAANPLLAILLIAISPLRAQGGDVSAPSFNFGTVDNNLLGEVNEYDHQLEKGGLLLHDDDLNDYVQDLGKKLIAHQPQLENVEFRFRVLRDPMVNAFALPNGSVYVTTGLLAVLENEAQLASVLGHEASHVIQRHTYLENRSMRKKVLTINILQGVAASMPGGTVFGAAVALGSTISAAVVAATIFGYSQEKEREADRNGFDLAAQAAYDPGAMVRTFELLDEKLEFEPVENFYRTHPKLEERHKAAQERLEAANIKGARLGTESEYLAHVAPAICANIVADLNCRRARTAVSRASRLTQWKPDEPKYQVLLGDAYRSLGAKAAQPTDDEKGRHGQAEHRKLYFRMTEQEEQAQLLAKPDGLATRNSNFAKAEKLYLGVVQQNPDYADAYRELGFLYEQEAKPADAAQEYRKYLDLTRGTTLDHLRIERRLAQVERTAPAKAPGQSK
jgi:Flp pilus assembly protein TadD